MYRWRAKELDSPGPISTKIGFILSRPNSIRGAASLHNAMLEDDFTSFGSDLHDLEPRFGAQKSMYREEYGFQVVTTRVNQLVISSRVPTGAIKSTQHYLGGSIRTFEVWLD